MPATSVFQNTFVVIIQWHACERQTHKALRNSGAKSKLGATSRHNVLCIDPYLGQKIFRAAPIKLFSSPPYLVKIYGTYIYFVVCSIYNSWWHSHGEEDKRIAANAMDKPCCYHLNWTVCKNIYIYIHTHV